jgi:hypothetical protein
MPFLRAEAIIASGQLTPSPEHHEWQWRSIL